MSALRRKVNSVNLESIGYDEQSQVLSVEFKTGSVYEYDNVPKGIYDEMERLGQESGVGAFFAASVKGAYRYRRLQ